MSDQQLPVRLENLLLVAAAGLFAAGLCFVPPTLFRSVDYVLFYKANFQFLADAVREGRFPLWNPYIGLGRPYLADMQNAVFYPPLYLICLGPRIGVFLLVWLHCVLAVLGIRSLAGALHAGRWQGNFMAFSFLASGALMARWLTGQLLYCCALCYMPWLFCYTARTDEAWRVRRVARHALLLALQFLCGHPQVFWFSVLGQAAFILGRAVGWPVRGAAAAAWRGLAQFGAACLWCAGLTAVVLLPFSELAKEGNRAAPSTEFANYGNLNWEDMGSLFSPLGLAYRWVSWEANFYPGPVVLVLGLAGLASVRERNVRGLLALLVAASLIAMGARTPLFTHFYKWLPGFASFRLHARAAALVVLVLICAAGIWLSRPHPKLKAAWTEHFALPLPFVTASVVLLQLVSLLFAAWQMSQAYTFGNIAGDSPDYPFQETLRAQLRDAGLMGPSLPPPRVCVPCGVVPANYAMIYRYSTFDAYTSLFLRRPWDYLHGVLGLQASVLWNTSLAGDVYAHGPFPYADLALAVGTDSAGTLQVATNLSARAFLVYAAEVPGSYGTILKRLTNGHDIHRSALLERPPAEPLPQQSALPATAAAIRRFEPNRLLVEVEAKTNALLVLAEAWYPGWRAEIDGRSYECLPANLWMRAVPVPAGRHMVRVYFRQNYLLPGLLISLASIFSLVVILARRGKSRSSDKRGSRLDAAGGE